MTMIDEKLQRCGHCGLEQAVSVLMSHSSCGGSTLLDTRRVEVFGGWLHLALAQCQRCGYVAQDLQQTPAAGAASALRQGRHLALLIDQTQPELVRRFRVEALLHEADGAHAAAAVAWWRAAWAGDDAADALLQDREHPRQGCEPPGDDPFAGIPLSAPPVVDPATPGLTALQVHRVQRWLAVVECNRGLRRQAAERFRFALSAGDPPLKPARDSELVLVDLLRRAGEHAAAHELALALLARGAAVDWDSPGGDALRLQVQLSAQGSDRAATMHEAEAASPDPQAARQRRAERAQRQAAEAARASAEHQAWCVPSNLGPPLAAAFERARKAGGDSVLMDGSWLQGLPITAGIGEQLAPLGARAGWPAAATLAALGLALQRVMPGLVLSADDRAWRLAVRGHAGIVDHLAFTFRRCRPEQWHYWPPAGPGDGPPLPDYRNGPRGT